MNEKPFDNHDGQLPMEIDHGGEPVLDTSFMTPEKAASPEKKKLKRESLHSPGAMEVEVERRASDKDSANVLPDSPSKLQALFSPQKTPLKHGGNQIGHAKELHKKSKRSLFSDGGESCQGQLTSKLKELLVSFEHRRIFLRRRYQFNIDGPETELMQLLVDQFLPCINARAAESEFPPTLDLEKIHRLAEKINAVFSGREQEKSFRAYVFEFRERLIEVCKEILPEVLMLKYPEILFHEREAIVEPFVAVLEKCPSHKLSALIRSSESLEALILYVGGDEKLFNYCRSLTFYDHWGAMVEHLHPDFKAFVVNHYGVVEWRGGENTSAFDVVFALYHFSRDMVTMQLRLERLIKTDLQAFKFSDWPSLLSGLLSANFVSDKVKDKDIESLHYPSSLIDKPAFYRVGELDFTLGSQGDSNFLSRPYLEAINDKPFDHLMRTLFRNYTQILFDYYKMADLFQFATLAEAVAGELNNASSLGDEELRAAYKTKGLGALQEIRTQHVQLQGMYQQFVDDFFTPEYRRWYLDQHYVSKLLKVIKPTSDEQLKESLLEWRQNCDIGDVLFIYEGNERGWMAYVNRDIDEGDACVERANLSARPSYLQLLESLTEKTLTEGKRQLLELLETTPIFLAHNFSDPVRFRHPACERLDQLLWQVRAYSEHPRTLFDEDLLDGFISGLRGEIGKGSLSDEQMRWWVNKLSGCQQQLCQIDLAANQLSEFVNNSEAELARISPKPEDLQSVLMAVGVSLLVSKMDECVGKVVVLARKCQARGGEMFEIKENLSKKIQAETVRSLLV